MLPVVVKIQNREMDINNKNKEKSNDSINYDIEFGEENMYIDIDKQINLEIESLIDELKQNNDFNRIKEIIKYLTIANIILGNKVNILENEIKKIKEELFQNELSPEDLRDILLMDYKKC
ncbi:MAG: hypothetical protein ACTSU2_08695 [Promethearchaeota archaeon]